MCLYVSIKAQQVSLKSLSIFAFGLLYTRSTLMKTTLTLTITATKDLFLRIKVH